MELAETHVGRPTEVDASFKNQREGQPMDQRNEQETDRLIEERLSLREGIQEQERTIPTVSTPTKPPLNQHPQPGSGMLMCIVILTLTALTFLGYFCTLLMERITVL